MGLWTPAPGFNYRQSNLSSITTTTIGTSVAAAGSAHTKGSWVQLIASTAQDCYWIDVYGCNTTTSATNARGLLDIGIGANPNEVVLIPDLLMGSIGSAQTTGGPWREYHFPLYIAAGTRISARFQSAIASKACGTTVVIRGGPERSGDLWSGSQVTAYGITAAASSGVSVTPGVSGAFGSYTQIVAATTSQHQCLVVGAQSGSSTAMAVQTYVAAVGVGAATEAEIANQIIAFGDASERVFGPVGETLIWRPIASGERLAIKLAQSSTTAQAIDWALYGVS